MKLVLFDDYRVGVLQRNDVVDITSAVRYVRDHPHGQRMNDIIANWDEFKPKITEAAKTGPRKAISQIKFKPPLPKPGKMLCLGVNYIEAARPNLAPLDAFVKTPDVLSADGDTITLPPFEARTCHPEPEMAFVVGKEARHVKAADAMKYIFGYMQFIDFSLRLSTPPTIPTLFASKGSQGFAPIGPALVTADDVPDPYNLNVKLTVNGHATGYHTRTMGHRLPETIEWLTTVCTLYPGDIVSMGTNHESLQSAMHGDEASLEIERLGPPLHIRVADTIPTRQFPREQH